MSDDAREKAKKLAAARKKLKEFQNRQNANEQTQKTTTEGNSKSESGLSTSSSSSVSNVNERVEGGESFASGVNQDTNSTNQRSPQINSMGNTNVPEVCHVQQSGNINEKFEGVEMTPAINSQEASPVIAGNSQTNLERTIITEVNPSEAFGNRESIETPSSTSGNASNVASNVPSSNNSPALVNYFDQNNETNQNLNTIQVLVNEKAQLTSELHKYRKAFQQKDLEADELRTLYETLFDRHVENEESIKVYVRTKENLLKLNTELQHNLAKTNAENKEKNSVIISVQEQLDSVNQKYKEKCQELEMALIRIGQLTDETSSSGSDSRVESLTQTQFMHEQQIRDLQAMVQQLSFDKEQSNQQFQNYVSHLKEEFNGLQTKYSEQTDELNRLQEREQELIEHVGTLEREIQKNIQVQQASLNGNVEQRDSEATPDYEDIVEKMKEQKTEFELEKHEFQLKIKSQEDNLIKLKAELQQKQIEIEELHTHLEHLQAEQPDTSKLLASMESDKVAASRAVQQNVELKEQLEQLEQKFVELTNDKADLVNQLDSEIFSNREMKHNYDTMEEQLRTFDERFKFKDEEMIRLSHENMELQRKNDILEQHIERLKNYEVEKYNENYLNYSDDSPQTSEENKIFYNENDHNHEHDHENSHKHDHGHFHDHEHSHDHDHDHENSHDPDHDHKYNHGQHDYDHENEPHHDHDHDHSDKKHEHHHHHHYNDEGNKSTDDFQYNHSAPDHTSEEYGAIPSHHYKQSNFKENDKSNDETDNQNINPDSLLISEDNCEMAKEAIEVKDSSKVLQHYHDPQHHQHHHHSHYPHHQHPNQDYHIRSLHDHHKTPYLPTDEAVEKLQQRFTNLISKVADLTDEKQHLEHLVVQLQSETEIIGEYIALYQHQRRILKQREYEKAAQTQLLQAERQQLREKINLLNNLVSSLGIEIPHHQNDQVKKHLNAALTESVSIEPINLQENEENKSLVLQNPENANTTNTNLNNDLNIKLNSNESQQIIAKIQDIITEIKENTKEIPTLSHNVDHLNCCLGKFEVV